MPESEPLPGNGAMVIVDEVLVTPHFDKVWLWMAAFTRAWRGMHREQTTGLDARGVRIWRAVLYSKYATEDPVAVAAAVQLDPHFFDPDFVRNGVAWIESFRASWLAHELDPEDTDSRGITLLWGPLMFVSRGNADPIELARITPVPDEYHLMLYPYDEPAQPQLWPNLEKDVPF